MDRNIKELLLKAYEVSSKEEAYFHHRLTGLYRRSWLVTLLQEALDKLGFEEERKKIDKELNNEVSFHE